MTARQLKDLFVNFFLDRGHVEIPSASLVPENDPTTLFISAGMHPLVPFLLGQPHPLGQRLVDVQKCIRTGDIDEVGNETHHTFFEMLGNWSLGDYFKETMIPWSYEFLTKTLNLDPARLSVTCFAGDADAPKDEDSAAIWRSQHINNIRFLPKSGNWWGPAGQTGPCGPDTEMFFDGIEIWNDVFMQYNKTADGKYTLLPQPSVDTRMGVERTIAMLNGFADDYLTPTWQPIIQKVEQISGKKYSDNLRSFRIIADHLRAAVFIIADGVEPSNKERGYVLRRLIRRSIRQGKLLGLETNFAKTIAQSVLDNQDNYAGVYPELNENKNKILATIDTEESKFRKTLNRGLAQINKLIIRHHNVSGKEAFDLYQSFGFPVEMIAEELQKNNLSLDFDEFDKFKSEHVQASRTLSAGMFKSGLADHSQIMTKYHTATHLLHAALRQILGTHVHQSGSNITTDRLRFDFTHADKLTDDQIKAVTALVNQKIQQGIDVSKTSQKFSDVQKSGALVLSGNKYPDKVSVYTIGNFSCEVCSGPHVANTRHLGALIITRQESAGLGKRRLYAILK